MPITDESLMGTRADGSPEPDYCKYCYREGRFTNEMPLSQFINRQVAIAGEKLGLDENTARKWADTVLPDLKRWKHVR